MGGSIWWPCSCIISSGFSQPYHFLDNLTSLTMNYFNPISAKIVGQYAKNILECGNSKSVNIHKLQQSTGNSATIHKPFYVTA